MHACTIAPSLLKLILMCQILKWIMQMDHADPCIAWPWTIAHMLTDCPLRHELLLDLGSEFTIREHAECL